MTEKRKTATENGILQDLMPKLEVNAVGVARLADWKGTKLEETALRLLPQTRSVIVFATEIYREILKLTSPERITGAVSLNDLYDRHGDYLRSRLTEAAYYAANAFRSAGLKALPLPGAGCPYDARFLDSIFSYKHAGQAAGLGKIGWNSLLIIPDFGPRVLLSACLTEAELEPTTVNMTFDCSSCRACLKICPVGALFEPQAGEQYAMNKFACCTFRAAAGGCSECMRVCPAH